MRFDLSQYALVEERLAKFWQDHPDGAVITDIVHHEENVVIFRASIYFERGGALVATGFAEEIRNASPVNKTSFVENAETSAIGRALANCTYQVKKRASREEMKKVERMTTAEQESDAAPALMSSGQRKTLAELTTKLGLNKQFRPYASKIIGREITDVGELTQREAHTLIAEMLREAVGDKP